MGAMVEDMAEVTDCGQVFALVRILFDYSPDHFQWLTDMLERCYVGLGTTYASIVDTSGNLRLRPQLCTLFVLAMSETVVALTHPLKDFACIFQLLY